MHIKNVPLINFSFYNTFSTLLILFTKSFASIIYIKNIKYLVITTTFDYYIFK